MSCQVRMDGVRLILKDLGSDDDYDDDDDNNNNASNLYSAFWDTKSCFTIHTYKTDRRQKCNK